MEGSVSTRRSVDQARLVAIGRDLLEAIGEDPDREGLRDTPARWARWWAEFMDHQPGTLGTQFTSPGLDQLVVIAGIESWSLCEHHLLPFSVTCSIGYIADGKVLGLSKFARIVHKHCHALQVQERLTVQIADEIESLTGSGSIAVLASGCHLCMAMRGVKSPATMVTSVMRGAFRHNPEARAEFLRLASDFPARGLGR